MAARSTVKRAVPSGPEGGRVSMREVAAQAGVSRSAVSLALQGHPSIPVATRERVLTAARGLGYRKNPLVAALMSARRTRSNSADLRTTLAFLTCHFPPDTWRQAGPISRFHAAASARAAELGFRLDEFSLGGRVMRPERLAALLKARGIHGLLVAPLPGEQTRLDFDVSEFAAIGLGLSVKEPGIDRVADDHFQSAQLAFNQALALGYSRIGLAVPADTSRRLEHRWWSGTLVAQQQLPSRARVPALMPETREALPRLLNDWIARHRVDAVVFALRDEQQLARVPAHVGLVSLSVPDESGRVAGIRQNERQVGEEAIELLVAKLHRWRTGASAASRLLFVPGTWSDGLSAPGPGQDRRALV